MEQCLESCDNDFKMSIKEFTKEILTDTQNFQACLINTCKEKPEIKCRKGKNGKK